jgi:hypothetical protein
MGRGTGVVAQPGEDDQRHGGRATVPFLRDMLELSSLPPVARRLVVIALVALVLTALLLPLTGVTLPKAEIAVIGGVHVRIAILFLVATICGFSIGWGYVFAAVLAAGPRLRWLALAAISLALGKGVVDDLLAAHNAGIEINPTSIGIFGLPALALLSLLWFAAGYRSARGISGVSFRSVAWCTLAVGVYFATFFVQRLSGTTSPALGLGVALLDVIVLTLPVLLPLYILAGIDVTEMLLETARIGVGFATRRVHVLRASLTAAGVGALAIAVEAIADTGSFDPLWIAWALTFALAVGSVLWLLARNKVISSQPRFAVIFWLVAAFWTLGNLSISNQLPGGLFSAGAVIGVGCLSLAIAFRRRNPGIALLLALEAAWLSFYNLPQISSPAVRNPLAAVVVLSGVFLMLISSAAWRYAVIRPLRTVVTVWTLAVLLMHVYLILFRISAGGLAAALPALEAALLIAVLAYSLRPVRAKLRVVVGSVAVVSLLASSALVLTGGGTVVVLAQSVVLAVGLLWDTLRSGRRVTNRSGIHWPRESRVIGYSGYSLVALSVAIFLAAAEGAQDAGIGVQPLTFPAVGLIFFGVPTVLYVLRADLSSRAGRSARM